MKILKTIGIGMIIMTLTVALVYAAFNARTDNKIEVKEANLKTNQPVEGQEKNVNTPFKYSQTVELLGEAMCYAY